MAKTESKRRGHNEGSIFQRGDGKWVGAVNLGWQNGKLKRKCKVADTRKEINEWLTPTLAKAQRGEVVAERQTVKQFLDRWLLDCETTVKAGTFDSYSQQVNGHLIPVLGGLQLSKLTPQHVQKYITDKQGAGLSPQTVRYQRSILRMALNQAEDWGLVTRNAAAKSNPPRVVKRKLQPMELEQARAFLETIKGSRYEILFTVLLSRGLRRGEALGLRWQDIDFGGRTLRICQSLARLRGELVLSEPKSKGSRRTLDLPDALVARLREHRTRQLEDRLKAGEKWADSGLVFTTSKGTAIDPRNVKRELDGLLRKAGLPHFCIHDLRHFCATIALAQTGNLKEVSELLGHSSIHITGDIYTDVLPSKRRESTDQMGTALFG